MSSSQCDPRCEDCGCLHCRCIQTQPAAAAAPVCRVCKGRRLIDGPSGHPEDATNCPACEDDEASQLADRAAAHPLPGVARAHYEGSFGQRLADAQRPRPLTVETAPIGTKAPACIGGYWIKTERGWKWCTGSTFPRPGGDWTGELIPPEPTAAKSALDHMHARCAADVKRAFAGYAAASDPAA